MNLLTLDRETKKMIAALLTDEEGKPRTGDVVMTVRGGRLVALQEVGRKVTPDRIVRDFTDQPETVVGENHIRVSFNR